MSKVKLTPGNLHLTYGRLCLDFANTLAWRARAPEVQIEIIPSYGDLVSWCQKKGVISGGEFRLLIDEAKRTPQKATKIYKRAIDLREAFYRIVVAVAQNKETEATDLDLFNAELSRTLHKAQIAQVNGGFIWGWVDTDDSLDQVLWPILRSAEEILTST